jgi:hypothetical protein
MLTSPWEGCIPEKLHGKINPWDHCPTRKMIISMHLGKKKKLVDIDSPLRKCAYQAFIIWNMDVVTLELDMKVQFANFWQTGHTKISALR